MGVQLAQALAALEAGQDDFFTTDRRLLHLTSIGIAIVQPADQYQLPFRQVDSIEGLDQVELALLLIHSGYVQNIASRQQGIGTQHIGRLGANHVGNAVGDQVRADAVGGADVLLQHG